MASLAMHKDMFGKVVPLDQSFEKGDYIGAFRFRFWRYGKWEEVVVDDYLPTINGRLILNRSNDSNKFWSALLEKAYAKIHGSYGVVAGQGTPSLIFQEASWKFLKQSQFLTTCLRSCSRQTRKVH